MLQPLVAGKCLEIPGTAESYQSFKNQVTVKAKEQSTARAYQRMASKLNSILWPNQTPPSCCHKPTHDAEDAFERLPPEPVSRDLAHARLIPGHHAGGSPGQHPAR